MAAAPADDAPSVGAHVHDPNYPDVDPRTGDESGTERDDVHTWFSLSYAAYLCVNRSLLQSMPDEWQHRFVQCMTELSAYFPNIREPNYTCHARDERGRFIRDPIPHYNRGRTVIYPSDNCGSRRPCWRCGTSLYGSVCWEPICDDCFQAVMSGELT